jgi:hypothetical protein
MKNHSYRSLVGLAALAGALAIWWLRPDFGNSSSTPRAQIASQPTQEPTDGSFSGPHAAASSTEPTPQTRAITASEIAAMLLQRAQTDPVGALEQALSWTVDESQRHQWVSVILRDWVGREPHAAWRWALEPHRAYVLPGEMPLGQVVINAVAERNIAQAVILSESALGLRETSFPVADGLVQALLQKQAAKTARELIERWLRTPAIADRVGNAPLDRLACELAETSRDDAAAWLLSLPATEARDITLATLAANWSVQSPRQAMDWATTLTSAPARTDAMQRVFSRWATADMPAAAQWLMDNEAHPQADTLIAKLVGDSTLTMRTPATAWQWTQLISDPIMRTQQMERVLRFWNSRDAMTAQRAVAEHLSLPTAERERLLAWLRTNPTPPNE